MNSHKNKGAMNRSIQNSPEKNPSLMLSLQRDSLLRNYYLAREGRKQKLIFMEEYSSFDNPDHYTVFQSWEDALRDLSKFEDSIDTGKRWWSYCPGWMYFNPAFIHKGLKQIFSKFIVQSLDGVVDSDVAKEEKERFNVWVQTCLHNQDQNFLTN